MDSLKNTLKKILVYWLSYSLTFLPIFNNFSYAGPQGGTVTDGGATISTPSPNTTQINQTTDKAVIDWHTFNVGSNESVNFYVPNSGSMTLNRVNPANGMSQIFGSIKSNGQLWLINPSGVLFGRGAQVDVASLMTTTANISNKDFMSGNFKFVQSPNWRGAIINEGTIRVADMGFAALVAAGVANRGIIQANLGYVTLASGSVFTVDLYGDQLINFGLNAETKMPGLDQNGNPLDAAVSNSGHIYANAGHVMLTAKTAAGVVDNVINMSGVIEAKSFANKNGSIVLSGGDEGIVHVSGKLDVSGKSDQAKGGRVQITGKKVGLFDGSHIDASGNAGGGQVLIGGDYRGKNTQVQNAEATYVSKLSTIDASALESGNGGTVIVWSDNTTKFYGNILARGGNQSGDGGFVEVSGKENLLFHGAADTRAVFGKIGTLLLDPKNITVANVGTATLPEVNAFSLDPGADYTISSSVINSATSNVVLEANNDITFNDVINMLPNIQLTARAGRNININSNITTNQANITMTANDSGADLNYRDAGAGGITMANGTTLTANKGTVNLQVASGANAGNMIIHNIFTNNNGSISLNSRAGTLVTNGTLKATGTGTISLTGRDGVTVNNTINTDNGAINISSTNSTTVGDITINSTINSLAGALTINTGRNLLINNAISTRGMTLNAYQGFTLNNTLDAQSGAAVINVNQSGAGANNFVMTSNGAITTTKAYSVSSPDAVKISVNNGGGSGSAVLGNISVNNANPGVITVATNTAGNTQGGSISQLAGTQINTGSTTNGKVVLAVSQTGTSTIQSQISGGQLDLTTSKAGADITSVGDLTLVAANLNSRGPLTLTTGGNFTSNAVINTGLVTLNAKGNISINQNLTGYGPMKLNADSDNNGSGQLSVANGITVNSSGFDMLVHANDINLNGILNSGAGTMTITASGAGNSIGIGNGAAGSLTLNDQELTNIVTTGARIFNADNGINLNTNSNAALNAQGALTLNADANNDGNGQLTLLGNGTITTNNNALSVFAGSLSLGNGKLNSGTNVLTINATGNNSSILLGDNGGSGTIEINSSQFSQLQGSSKVFNANNGITITNDYQTNGALTFNADYDANGQGLFRLAQGAHVVSNNSPLSIIAATLDLTGSAAVGAINSGTGAFTLTATGKSNSQPSLGIGNGANGIINLSDSELNNKLIANGARIFNGVDGITVNTSPANGNALTLNADYDNNGVGLLTIAPNLTINTNNNALALVAATMNLGANTVLNSGTGTFSLTATGKNNNQPSLGVGDTANGILNLSNAQMANQIIANGARIFNGVDGISITYQNFSNNQALTLNADYDNDGVGHLLVNPNIAINSGNGNLNVTAATGNLNGNGLKHGTGALVITGTGFNSPSLGLGNSAGGQWNISDTELANSTGTGVLTFNGRNGITVNYNIPNTLNNTLTFNADTDQSGVGTLTVMNGKTINSNNGALNITAADLNLNTTGAINSGTGNVTINATSSIGIGNAAGTMQISNAELRLIRANNLILNTVGNFIASDGVTATAVSNITNTVNLIAKGVAFNSNTNPNSLNSVVNFIGSTSNFKTLMVQGDSGININANVASSNNITLGQGADTGLNSINVGGNYSVNAADGITINNTASWSSRNTFSLNANSNNDANGVLVLANNANLGTGQGNLNITAQNIDLSQGGKINLTTGTSGGNLAITGTSSVGLGSAAGNMNLSNAVLQKLFANNLTVNSGANQQVIVTGVSLPDTAGILSNVSLNATNGSTGNSNVIFQGTDSQFKNLSATANNNINIKNNLSVNSTLNLTTNLSGNITQDAGTIIQGTTLSLKTATGSANLTNLGNKFSNLTANSTSGNIQYTNALGIGLSLNASNLGTGSLTVTTQGTGAITQAGIVTANILKLFTQSGDATLTLNNAVNSLLFNSVSGNLNYKSASGQTLSLLGLTTSGNLTITQQGSGNLNQTGAILGNALNLVLGTGTATLNNLGNQVNTLAATTTGGNVAYTNLNALAVNTSSLSSGSLNVVTQTGNILLNGHLTAGNVTLNAQSGGINLNGKNILTPTASGTVTLWAQGSGSNISNATGTLAGKLLNVLTKNTSTSLQGNFGELIANSTGGNFTYTNIPGRDLQLNQVDLDTDNLTINLTNNNLTQAGVITGGDLILNLGTGSAILNTAVNQFLNLDGGNTKGSISYKNNGDINLRNIALGITGDLSIQTLGSGDITQTTNISGRNLTLITDSGDADLDNNPYQNQFNTLTAISNSGTIDYVNTIGLLLNASSLGTGDLNVGTKTGNITLGGNLNAENIHLDAESGGISLSNHNISVANQLVLEAGNNGNIDGNQSQLTGKDLTVYVRNGTANLNNANNDFDTLTATSFNNGSVNYTNKNKLTIRNSNLQLGSLNAITKTGNIILDGDIAAGNVSLTAQLGGIDLANHNIETPLSTGTVTLLAQGLNSTILHAAGTLAGKLLTIQTNHGNADIHGNFAELIANTSNGDLIYTGIPGRDLQLNQVNLGTGDLTINLTNNNLTQTGAISGSDLTLNLGTGSALLNTAVNQFINLDGGNTQGSISYKNATDINLRDIALGSTGDLSIETQNAGKITQSSSISGRNLVLITDSGSAVLNNNVYQNQFDTLKATSNSGTINYLNANGLTLNASQVGIGSLNVATKTGTLLLAGNLSGNNVTLQAKAGDINLSNHNISVSNQLTLQAGGNGNIDGNQSQLTGKDLIISIQHGTADLNNANNDFDTLTANSIDGSVSYTNKNKLSIKDSNLQSGSLKAITKNGDITLDGDIDAGDVNLTSELGNIDLASHNIDTPLTTGTVVLSAQGVGSAILNGTGILSGKILAVQTNGGNTAIHGNFSGLIANTSNGDFTYTGVPGRDLQLTQVNLGTGDLTINLTDNNVTQLGTIIGSDLTLNLGNGSAILNAAVNQFINLDGGNTQGSISYKNSGDINLRNIALGSVGDLSVETQGAGKITQSTNISGRNLVLSTDSGSVTLDSSAYQNQFDTLSVDSNSGVVNYTNKGTLTVLDSNVHLGTLNVASTNGDINLGGDIVGTDLNLNALAGSIGLGSYSMTADHKITLKADQNVTGNTLTAFPKLIADTIQITTTNGYVGTDQAPIGIVVQGLSNNSFINDASLQTGLGYTINASMLASEIIKDPSHQFYLYPLLSPDNPVNAILEVVVSEDTVCTAAYQLATRVNNYHLLPSFCYHQHRVVSSRIQ